MNATVKKLNLTICIGDLYEGGRVLSVRFGLGGAISVSGGCAGGGAGWSSCGCRFLRNSSRCSLAWLVGFGESVGKRVTTASSKD